MSDLAKSNFSKKDNFDTGHNFGDYNTGDNDDYDDTGDNDDTGDDDTGDTVYNALDLSLISERFDPNDRETTYTFDEVVQWANEHQLSQKKKAAFSGSGGGHDMKKIIFFSVLLILIIICIFVVLKKKKTNKLDPKDTSDLTNVTSKSNQYINVETGKQITLDELNSGEYELVAE